MKDQWLARGEVHPMNLAAGTMHCHAIEEATSRRENFLNQDFAAFFFQLAAPPTAAQRNRGYGAPRARCPMDFDLLNHDCLWVMDGVQLMGWTERVLGLLKRHGPFALAWTEAVMSAEDQRASRDATLADPALMDENDAHGLEASHSSMEVAARGGEDSSELAQHSAERGSQHGVRGRAGRPGDARSSTRAPGHATRYLDTRFGALSYLELAQHLALAGVSARCRWNRMPPPGAASRTDADA